MNTGKKYKVWLTLDEIEKVKDIIPYLDVQIDYPKKSRRTPYQIEYYLKNREKIKKYYEEYRKKKKAEKEKLEKEKRGKENDRPRNKTNYR